MSQTKLQPMTDDELLKVVTSLAGSGQNPDDSEESSQRQSNLDRYMGKPDGSERAGSSQVVTREVFEAVEWAMASLMRVFAASERPVSFDPEGPEDEEAAKQETEYLNHVILKENRAYMNIHGWAKEMLMSPVAYCKVWVDERKTVEEEEHPYLHTSQVELLMQDQNVEILAADLVDQDETGEYYTVVTRVTRRRPRIQFQPVPGEEIEVDDDHTEVSLEDCPMVNHRRKVTISDLIEMGYPKEEVLDLSDDDDGDLNAERINRLGDDSDTDEEASPATREVWLNEMSIVIDYDGDGIAERRKVVFVGNKLLENEQDSFVPIVAAVCIPMPNAHEGLSLADVTTDLQKIETQLTRQMLNNLYRTNNPRPVVGQGVSYEDLMNDAPNHPIRARDISQIRMEPVTPVINQVLPALEHFKQRGQTRTGIGEHTMGLSPDVLAQATKGAALMGLEQANGRLEMIARNFAESLKELFLKVHYLSRNYVDVTKHIRISGGWVPINPVKWRSREDMTINVGIGNSTKEQKLVSAKMIMDTQEKMVMAGGMGRLVSEENIFNAASQMVEAAGQPNPLRFFMDPRTAPPQAPPKPDPQEMLIQLQAEVERMRAEIEREKMQLQAVQADQDAILKERDQALQERELAIKEAEIILDAQVEMAKLGKTDVQIAASLQEVRERAQAEIERERIKATAGVASAAVKAPVAAGGE